ncbi:MAG: DUF2953 domain-containing protein [Oscillospiraceae bacterium]|nr:DUF2953 domain-containing protein [Oscillospiraceae bacterium]
MGWLIALGVLALLAILPLGVAARYDSDGPLVKLIAGPVRVTLYPAKRKEKKDEPVQKKKPAASSGTSAKKKKGGNYSDFLPLIQLILEFLDAFRWKLRVNILELKLIMAGDDPCDLAVNYGRAWAALGNLMPVLERHLVIKKRDLEVECDFTSDTTVVYARADLTITLGRILSLGVVHGFRILRQYFKIVKMRKGGAKL